MHSRTEEQLYVLQDKRTTEHALGQETYCIQSKICCLCSRTGELLYILRDREATVNKIRLENCKLQVYAPNAPGPDYIRMYARIVCSLRLN